jgi:hypothetical protein
LVCRLKLTVLTIVTQRWFKMENGIRFQVKELSIIIIPRSICRSPGVLVVKKDHLVDRPVLVGWFQVFDAIFSRSPGCTVAERGRQVWVEYYIQKIETNWL